MHIKFLLLGAPVALLLWSLRSARIGKTVRFSGAVLALVVMTLAGILIASPPVLSDVPWFERSPWKEGLLLFTMLLGMAARSLDLAIEIRSQRIAQLRAAGKLRRKPKLPLDSWDFSRPFLVALPTFGGLLGQIGDQALGWVLIVLAFQTGFFWQTVLKKADPA